MYRLNCHLTESLSARRAWIEISVTRYRPIPSPVALRKESVDRNNRHIINAAIIAESLSARRAWIEMRTPHQRKTNPIPVALRKESVDRNSFDYIIRLYRRMSLSARRAWIEIPIVPAELTTLVVALRKESVDRNA